jgi:UDP-N-acetylmuramyl pentapeptide phosphotransferase/UDP-N-acetylglucosamine-1-phosphate transferase
MPTARKCQRPLSSITGITASDLLGDRKCLPNIFRSTSWPAPSELAVLCGAIVGVGFLWFDGPPAAIFMPALGGLLGMKEMASHRALGVGD